MKDHLHVPLLAEFSLTDNQQVALRFKDNASVVIQLDTVNCPNMSAAFAELCWNNSQCDGNVPKNGTPALKVANRYMGGDHVLESSSFIPFREKIVDKVGNVRAEDWRDSVLKKNPAHKWAIYYASPHPCEVKSSKGHSTVELPKTTEFVLTTYSNYSYVFGHVVRGDAILDDQIGMLNLEGCDYLNDKGYAIQMTKMSEHFKKTNGHSYGWKMKSKFHPTSSF